MDKRRLINQNQTGGDTEDDALDHESEEDEPQNKGPPLIQYDYVQPPEMPPV